MRIPLDPTPTPAAAYRTVLARSYELLADAKPSRHAGYRAAQMRNVCLELRKVGGGRRAGAKGAWALGGRSGRRGGGMAAGRRLPGIKGGAPCCALGSPRGLGAGDGPALVSLASAHQRPVHAVLNS